jgi:hypothetical protein
LISYLLPCVPIEITTVDEVVHWLELRLQEIVNSPVTLRNVRLWMFASLMHDELQGIVGLNVQREESFAMQHHCRMEKPRLVLEASYML